MPIVDGLTSAKMIRSIEKSHPTHTLSKRAALNGRVPIIAVSASLIEKERPLYIEAGFDGWILKPIAFDRLKHIMTGIVDAGARKAELYKPGGWERGGWFQEAQTDIYAANTKPGDKMPMSDPSEGAQNAAGSRDPFVREEDSSLQTQEQKRMADEQEKGREELGEDGEDGSEGPKISAVVDTASSESQAADGEKEDEVKSDASDSVPAET